MMAKMTKNFSLHLTALPTKQPIGEFFLAKISAKDLVGISYADVRRLAGEERAVERYLGIQRPLSKKRVKEIKRYIKSPDATFPTAIILAIDEKCAEYDRDASKLTLSNYQPEELDSGEEPIDSSFIAKILDGQHRIAAFMDENGNWDDELEGIDFDLNLAIFIGADLPEQASIFATVNLAQTKVNRSLVYDLTELAQARSPYKTCHNIAVALDSQKSSPFYKRIKRLGTATPGRKHEPLTQASFVEALSRLISKDPQRDRNDILDGKRLKRATKEELLETPFRNLFIDKRDTDIAEIVLNYYKAVRLRWPESWDAVSTTGNLLPRTNAFKALMKFLKDDVYIGVVGNEIGRVPNIEEFAVWFEDMWITDSDFTSRNFKPGSSGQSTFLKMLRKQISREEMMEE